MKRLFLTIGLGIAIFTANAQTASPQLVSLAGDSFKNTSYQLDWSIGECITATLKAGDYVLIQGFHQNTYSISAIKDTRAEIDMTVYPNPTSDFISMQINSPFEGKKEAVLQYTITDLSGKILQTAEIKSDLQQIDFINYAVGTYFIAISQKNILLKTFKIIKK